MAFNQSPEAAINAKPKGSDNSFMTALTDGMGEFGGAFRDAYASIPMPHAKFPEFQHESPGVDKQGVNFEAADVAMAAQGKNLYGSWASPQARATTDENTVNRWVNGQFGPVEEAA